MDSKTDEIPISDLQMVQITRLGVGLLGLDHQVVQITKLGVILLEVMDLDPRVVQITNLGVALLTVLALDHQAEQITDLGVALLVDIRVLEAEDTSNLLEVQCGENPLDQVTEALHNNNTPSLV